MSESRTSLTVDSLGLPGNLLHLAVRPGYPEGDPRNAGGPAGTTGDYKVIFTLARPGTSPRPERSFTFADQLVGDSHVAIARPACNAPEGTTSARFDVQYAGGSHVFFGFPNDKGFLARIEVPVIAAAHSRDAMADAYKIVAPLLSGVSLLRDIPIVVFQIDAVELRTTTMTLRGATPFIEATIPQSSAMLEAELRGYASIYREAINNGSPFYQFLCLYKIIEAIRVRRDLAPKN